jgi:hypothetical protein
MNRKLTISIDENVYNGLLAVIGRGRIGEFLEGLARPLVVPQHLDASYAEIASDSHREAEADEWVDGLHGDVSHASW